MTTKAFFSSVAKFSISSWVNFFIGIASVMITTRIFTPEIFGMLNMFNTASGMLVGLSGLGLDGAFIRFYYEPPKGWDAKQLFAKCLLISCASLTVISIIELVFFYEDVTNYLFHQISFFFAVLLTVNAFSMLILTCFFSQYYRMSNDPYHYTIQQVLINFFSKLFVVSAAAISPTIQTVLMMNTVGIFMLMIVYFFIQHKRVFPDNFNLSFAGFGPVFRFALFYWPQSLITTVEMFLIPFVIMTKLGGYALGIYASAGFFVSAFNVIQGGFRTYWSAFMYQHYLTEQARIIKIHNYITVFIIFIFASFILMQHIIYMMIGSEFHESRIFFSLVLISPLLSLLQQTTEYGTNLMRKNHQNLIIFAMTTIINILGTFFLLPVVGLIGAAMASASAAVIRFLLSTWRGQIYYKSIDSYAKTLMGLALIVLLAVSNVLLIDKYTSEFVFVIGILLVALMRYRDILLDILHLRRI